MNVLVLGGTGSIGGAVVDSLRARNHEVLALGRSAAARATLRRAGATPVEGDLREPEKWIGVAREVDGIVHTAAAWGKDMVEVDRRFVELLLDTLRDDRASRAFVYTGGCWLFGATGDALATEESPFDPLRHFAGTVPTIRRVLDARCVRGMVVHPALVYERDGGVFEHFIADARDLGYVRVVGGEDVRWPLVHRVDLAGLYALVLERGRAGATYNGAAMAGVRSGDIARAIAGRLGARPDPVVIDAETAMADIGYWADGYALDQQMSSRKAMEELGWRPAHTDAIRDVS